MGKNLKGFYPVVYGYTKKKKEIKQRCDIPKPNCTHCIVSFEVYEANEFAFSLCKRNTYLLIMLKQRHEFKLTYKSAEIFVCNSTT